MGNRAVDFAGFVLTSSTRNVILTLQEMPTEDEIRDKILTVRAGIEYLNKQGRNLYYNLDEGKTLYKQFPGYQSAESLLERAILEICEIDTKVNGVLLLEWLVQPLTVIMKKAL